MDRDWRLIREPTYVLGPLEIRRTCLGNRDTSYAPVERDTSYVPGTCSRIFVRDKGPEMLRACHGYDRYQGALGNHTRRKLRQHGSTVIPEPLAWHISPSDANLRNKPMGEKTLNLSKCTLLSLRPCPTKSTREYYGKSYLHYIPMCDNPKNVYNWTLNQVD